MKNILLIMLSILIGSPALATEPIYGQQQTVKQAGEVQHLSLKKIDPQYICMVNNTAFDKPQIPVQVGEKTYYGCCQMCEARLKNDPQARTAIDPVSSKSVDKSTAVIGVDNQQAVYYFENEENMKQFNKGKQP